jgi:hypothetical protein
MQVIAGLARTALTSAAFVIAGSVASAQMVPPPTDYVDAGAFLCNARTNGVNSRNPDILTETSGAVLEVGGSWDAEVDVSTFTPGTVTLFIAAEHRRIRLSSLTQIILIDPPTTIVRRTVMHGGGSPVQYSFPIPNDPALCDVDVWVQALVIDSSGITLSNGLHVYVGN